MPEYTNANVQVVAPAGNVLFTETHGGCRRGDVVHRDGSGLVTLRGMTDQCRARYKVSFGANIAVPAGGTAGPISVALAVEGEPMNSATATVTPAAVGDYMNVYVSAYVEVPRGCCLSVGVRNISAQAVSVANPNMIVERTA